MDRQRQLELAAGELYARKHVSAARRVKEHGLDADEVIKLLEPHIPAHALQYYQRDLEKGLESLG